MRVAATDYDGTLCMKRKVASDDLAAIAEWRGRGNAFGIVTGRELSMLLPEVRHWGIPFDYLVCCSGAVVYRAELEILDSASIADDLVTPVLGHSSAGASLHYELCRNGEVFLLIKDPASWFPKLGTPYTEITPEEALSQTGLQQISLAYRSPEEGGMRAAALDEAFGDVLRVHHNGSCVDITARGVCKAAGIRTLLEHTGWPSEGLLFIGDGENDIPAIREFAGFTVPGASAAVTAEASAVCASVGAMLRAAME